MIVIINDGYYVWRMDGLLWWKEIFNLKNILCWFWIVISYWKGGVCKKSFLLDIIWWLGWKS